MGHGFEPDPSTSVAALRNNTMALITASSVNAILGFLLVCT